MTKRRVIFPDPDYWTQRKDTPVTDDHEQAAIRNCPDAKLPDDVILTYAESIRVMVSGGPERSLIMALHLTLPAPLGDVEVFLGREQILNLHDHMADLINLDDEQTEVLLTRLHGEPQ
jgi:hypothetical protein